MAETQQSATALQQDSDASADAVRWENVRNKLRSTFGEAVYRSWFDSLSFVGIDNGVALMSAPTRFVREWVMSNYADELRNIWRQEREAIFSVDVVIGKPAIIKRNTATTQAPAASSRAAPADAVSASLVYDRNDVRNRVDSIDDEEEFTIGSPLDPRFTFENFVVGKPNELAYAAARRVAEADEAPIGCNPLFLHGGVGLGKTHLMHALAWQIRRENPNRRVLYLSAEKFMYQFIRALRFKDTMAFKEKLRSVDVLMIDDVQFISGKDSTQEEFFHTFNALIDQKKQLIISGDRSPSDLEGIEERIRSRLGWGLVADIHSTTYELRLGILQSKAERLDGLEIPQKVLEFLAMKITSNIRELEGALNRVVAHSTLVGQAITVETTQDVLKDLLRANDRHITIEDIQKAVATHYNIKLSEMHSARRSRVVARPRQVAMYLAKRLTSKSLPEIGRKFGGKDHTTVMHAVKRIEELRASDHDLSADIELLNRALEN
ncbi:MAG: chromosomal replication initiator protein DnaA [Alphaproteobacteria bacterium]|nr:chromosomal replication initiator protein DnaA [Alphaproteobacteria bacterium]